MVYLILCFTLWIFVCFFLVLRTTAIDDNYFFKILFLNVGHTWSDGQV